MKITSTAQARKVLEVGMIVYWGDGYLKVLELNDDEVSYVDVEYDEDIQDYKEVGKVYHHRTYTDFIGNEI